MTRSHEFITVHRWSLSLYLIPAPHVHADTLRLV